MLIVHIVDPFAGGLATFLKLLTTELTKDYHIIIHGERRELVDPKLIKKRFPRKNIRFIHWKSVQREIHPIKDIQAYICLKRIMRHFAHADVVHLHSSKAGFLGRLVCKQLGIKKVIYTPNGAPFQMKSESRIKTSLYSALEKFAYRLGGKVICTSESEYQAYLAKGIQAEYINNGTKIGFHSFVADKNYSKFRIVTSGRIARQKDPALFNRIASALIDLKHFEFVWIGDGDERDKALLTSPNITIAGWLDRDTVRQELAKADLYLSTSEFEGLPFAVIEAMGMGKCLLLSDCTGNVDLVKKEVNGRIFSSSEEAINNIIYFYLNREMTESMGIKSIEICRDYFNIEETAFRYRIEYQKLKGITTDKKELVLVDSPSDTLVETY